VLARYLRLDGELAERASPSSSVVEARARWPRARGRFRPGGWCPAVPSGRPGA